MNIIIYQIYILLPLIFTFANADMKVCSAALLRNTPLNNFSLYLMCSHCGQICALPIGTLFSVNKQPKLHLENSKYPKKPSCPILGARRSSTWGNTVYNPLTVGFYLYSRASLLRGFGYNAVGRGPQIWACLNLLRITLTILKKHKANNVSE